MVSSMVSIQKIKLTILLKESISAFDAVSLSGLRFAEAFFSPEDSSSPEETHCKLTIYTMENLLVLNCSS